MFRNKVLCTALLVLSMALPAFAQSPNLISEDMIVTNTVNYDMHTVERGSIESPFSVNGDIHLSYTYYLTHEANGLTFVEYKVKRNDVVKAGDVLAVFDSNVDEVELARQQKELERTQEALELERASRREAIDEMYMSLLDVPAGYERALLELRIERAEIAFEQYVYQKETDIENIRMRIEAMEAQRAESLIVAPVDGIIDRTMTRRAGDRIYRDEVMVVMYSTDGVLIRVNNKQGKLRYGMPVEISAGNGSKKQIIPGRVVSADQLLPEAQKTEYAYIMPEYYDPATTPIDNLKVSGNSVHLENVIQIPRKAVKLEMSKNYVMKLSDGITQKRYIQALSRPTYVMVFQGLEAGEQIIIE